MEGLRGKVVSGALGEENVMLAEGSFSGQSILAANLASKAKERAFSSGSVALDDMVILDDGSFAAVSAESNNRIMGMAGMKLVEDGKGTGSFGMSAMNLDLTEEKGESAGAGLPDCGGSIRRVLFVLCPDGIPLEPERPQGAALPESDRHPLRPHGSVHAKCHSCGGHYLG